MAIDRDVVIKLVNEVGVAEAAARMGVSESFVRKVVPASKRPGAFALNSELDRRDHNLSKPVTE